MKILNRVLKIFLLLFENISFALYGGQSGIAPKETKF